MSVKYYTWLHVEILRQGLSIAEVAREADICYQSVVYYVNGDRDPPRRHANKLGEVLGVHPSNILDRDPYILQATAARSSP